MSYIDGNLIKLTANSNLIGKLGPASNANIWQYINSVDNMAAVSASGFFKIFGENTLNVNGTYPALNDFIYCVCSDGTMIVKISALSPAVTVQVIVGPGGIQTDEIADDAITTAKILDANVTLAKLAAGITPSHIIKYAGQTTTVGGAAAEAFAVAGVLATDLAFVQIVDNGTGNVTALQAVCTLNTLTITFSGNPGNDTIFNYQIIRASA
jgi:hypothetical protein